jgi:hypothetical protein
VRNQLVAFLRAAVSLKGKPAYYSENNQRRDERDIRFIFQAQGHRLALSPRASFGGQLEVHNFYHGKSIRTIEIDRRRFGVRLDNGMEIGLEKSLRSKSRD